MLQLNRENLLSSVENLAAERRHCFGILKSALTPYGTRSGEIRFLGDALEQVSVRTQASEIGYVLQSPDNQIVTDKVWHEMAFGLENLGYDQQTIRLRVAEMASFFGIQNWFAKNVEELSGGQKQLFKSGFCDGNAAEGACA